LIEYPQKGDDCGVKMMKSLKNKSLSEALRLKRRGDKVTEIFKGRFSGFLARVGNTSYILQNRTKSEIVRL